jgi:hypothetical protein
MATHKKRRPPRQLPTDSFLPPSQTIRSRVGENYQLEDEAEKRLATARRQEDDPDMTLYLSREQMLLRQKREIMNVHGVPDSRLFSGLYVRAYNPEMGSRPHKNMKGADD